MTKKMVVITGASSGIGLACAKVFSEAGYALLLLARRLEPMQALNLPDAICKSVDITDFAALKEALESIDQGQYHIDCLINNAGCIVAGHFSETDIEAENTMVDLNLKGVMHAVKLIAPMMQQQKFGTIINMSSIGDRMFASPTTAVYCAAKAALKQFTQSMHAMYKDHNIRCCNLAPGYIETPIWSDVPNPSFAKTGMKLIPAIDFAKMVLWIYQQPQEICIRDLVVTPTLSPI